jgi:hypothetical protein
MILTNQTPDVISKSEIEQVQQEKQEYYFLGSFIRRAGLKLFAYNPQKNEVYELKIKYSNTIHAVPQDGRLVPVDYEAAKCTIDSRHEVFEALNYNTAITRLFRWKSGQIPTLCNLKRPNPNALRLF